MKAENGVMDVTLSPGVPNLQQIEGHCQPYQLGIEITEVSAKSQLEFSKNSLPEIQVITSIAPPRETFSVKTVAARGSMEGTFVLQIDQSEYGKDLVLLRQLQQMLRKRSSKPHF